MVLISRTPTLQPTHTHTNTQSYKHQSAGSSVLYTSSVTKCWRNLAIVDPEHTKKITLWNHTHSLSLSNTHAHTHLARQRIKVKRSVTLKSEAANQCHCWLLGQETTIYRYFHKSHTHTHTLPHNQQHWAHTTKHSADGCSRSLLTDLIRSPVGPAKTSAMGEESFTVKYFQRAGVRHTSTEKQLASITRPNLHNEHCPTHNEWLSPSVAPKQNAHDHAPLAIALSHELLELLQPFFIDSLFSSHSHRLIGRHTGGRRPAGRCSTWHTDLFSLH